MDDGIGSLKSDQLLVLLPAYLGISSIEDALQTARGRQILWLEILLNDQLDLTARLSKQEFCEAYQTACRWYTHYRRLITYLFNRTPLPLDSGPIDFRHYRLFSEAARFVYEGSPPRQKRPWATTL